MAERLPLENILKIIKIRVKDNMGYRRIARKTGVHWLTVRKYVKLFEEV